MKKGDMMKKSAFTIFIVSLFSLLVWNCNAHAQIKLLFDDFSSGYFAENKWWPREYVRYVDNGKYVSKLGNSKGMGAEVAPGVFQVDLSFVDPENIHTIQADISLSEVRLDQQGTNTESYGMLGGRFYNVSSVAGGIGDIWAEIGIGDRGNGLEAFWAVARFTSDDYSQWEFLGNGTINLGSTIQIDVPVTAKIAYDGNKTFEFSIDGQSATFVGQDERKSDAYNAYKGLIVGIEATDGSDTGYISATFDNVYINNSSTIYDDFSAATIDLSKWTNSEWVREISNGRLQSIYKRSNSTGQVNTYLSAKDTPYFEATARIDSSTQISNGAVAVARLQGYYYNDSRGPGSGNDYNVYEGDIFVQIRLEYRSDGTLSAIAFVDRSNEPDESNYTNLFSHTFATPIFLDTDYTLSINYEKDTLIFKCNDETALYTITSPMYPPYGEHRLLRSRLYLDPGESGYLKTQFDNIYIKGPITATPAINFLLLN